MAFEMTPENIEKLHWHSVKDLLPYKRHEFMLVAHKTGNQLEVVVGFFDPIHSTFGKIGEHRVMNGEDAWKMEDITKWVDYWAFVPHEMFEGGDD